MNTECFWLIRMSDKKRIFIICGEKSGDIIGAELISKLSEKFSSNIEFCGIGGENMTAAGFQEIFSITELSVMGIFDVVKKLCRILKLAFKTIKTIKEYKPDVVIAIDAQEFSRFILKRIPQYKRVLYVAPSAWAWRPWRAKTIKKYVDYLLVLFPFEEEFFKQYGVNVIYVGHPLITKKELVNANAEKFLQKYGIKKPILLILPGSRKREIETLLPIFIQAAKKIKYRYDMQIVLHCVHEYYALVNQIIVESGVDCLVVTDNTAGNKYDLFKAARVAIAASGTVTFELGLLGTRTIVCYKAPVLIYFLLKHFLVSIKFIGLVNIIMNRKVMPELLQEECNMEKICCVVEALMFSKKSQDDLKCFQQKIQPNDMINFSKKAADVIYNILN